MLRGREGGVAMAANKPHLSFHILGETRQCCLLDSLDPAVAVVIQEAGHVRRSERLWLFSEQKTSFTLSFPGWHQQGFHEYRQ